jgi:hypothetical protein
LAAVDLQRYYGSIERRQAGGHNGTRVSAANDMTFIPPLPGTAEILSDRLRTRLEQELNGKLAGHVEERYRSFAHVIRREHK